MDILLFPLAILLMIVVLVPVVGMFAALGLLTLSSGKAKKPEKNKTWEELYGEPFPPPLYQDSFSYAHNCAAKSREQGDEAGAKRWEDAVKPFKAFGRDD